MRTIGIDPGDQSVKVVELDGGYRRARLLAVHHAPAGVPTAGGGTRSEVVAAAAAAAIADGMRGEVALGHPCREAILRTLELPFTGREAIRKVVKAEIEGEIQGQSVDDMIVDFLELGRGAEGGTRILVASVPKAGLRTQLAALDAKGVEPQSVDLDTMALWRAAHYAGAFLAIADGPADALPPVTAVVDVGSRSVKVLIVEGEKLVEMRALRLGEGAIADEIARKHGGDVAAVRDAVHRSLVDGGDVEFQVGADLPALAGGEASAADPAAAPAADPAAAPAPRTVRVAHAEVAAAHRAWLQRLSRELTRFLTASGRATRLAALFVTGGASELPGTGEMLADVFGVTPQPLDVLAKLQHDLTPEQAKEYGPRIATAVGLALGALGGPDGFQLRQEDLVLTRGFERVKFPLAIACMVAMLALFVQWNRQQQELSNLGLRIGSTYRDAKDPKKVAFFGMLGAVMRSGWFDKADHFRVEQQKGKDSSGKDYTAKDLVADLDAMPVQDRLRFVREKLRTVAKNKQAQSGVSEDVSVESGLAVLSRWSALMKELEPTLGRFLVTRVNLTMKAPNRQLQFVIAFRGDDFRSRHTALKAALDAEMAKPDSPFEPPDPKKPPPGKDVEQFRDTANSGVAGAYYTVTLPIKDVFQSFGPARGAAVGAVPTRDGLDGREVAATGGGR
ncbi:MAG: pilus assembly protein PilM [Planctomycetota bacterium]